MTLSNPEHDDGIPAVGGLNVRWICGSRYARRRTDPPIQVHRYDEHTYILRQSKDVSAEAPFMYLLFGNDRALLLDTGATKDATRFPIRSTVDKLIEGFAANHPGHEYELLVAHTHGHEDHVAGDGQFAGRPRTTVVGSGVDSVSSFFGISSWADGMGRCDLGRRVLEVLPTPGHHKSAVAIYDPWTGTLLTGDTVLPGRLYAFDPLPFISSLDKLVSFARDKSVGRIMGCHIEMTRTPGEDYPIGTRYQPDEPPLQMTVRQLVAMRDAAVSINGRPGRYVFDDFVLFNFPCYRSLLVSLAKGFARNLKHELGVSQDGPSRTSTSE